MAKILKPFVKNYNMYEIPNTRNCFKVEVKQESKKPMFLCVYQEVVRNQYQDNVISKHKRVYDKQEALNFVLEKYNIYLASK